MSNNLVSQQLSVSSGDISQPEPAYVNVDSSLLNMQMGMTGTVSSDSVSHQFPISNQQMQLVDAMSSHPASQNMTVSNRQLGNTHHSVDNIVSHKLLPLQKEGEMDAILNDPDSQKIIYPNKRKAATEPIFNRSDPSQTMPSKRQAHMVPVSSSAELLNQSGTNKKAVHLQSVSSTSNLQVSPAPNKRMARNESISNKSGSQRAQMPKGRTVQTEIPRKNQSESFEAVRSKMRETIAGALVLVVQSQTKTCNEEKSSLSVDITPSPTPEDSSVAESISARINSAELPKDGNGMHSTELCSADKPHIGQNTVTEGGMGDSQQTWKSSGQDSLYSAVLPDTEVSFADTFFVKDELLQGNGLSWAWDMDMEMVEAKEIQAARHVDGGGDGNKQEIGHSEVSAVKTEEKEVPAAKHLNVGEDEGDKNLLSPEKVAFRIEMELFKLFGGVNKKYKEKGRSLTFNLKDRNNPELREKVMSGEISPEKLCSMNAEELASKELSEWRMAKAEELAQMKVLPDSDGDRRRLVKKTHKGEYQVEVEHDDGVSVEVSVGATTLTQIHPKDDEKVPSLSDTKGVNDLKSAESEKVNLENQDSSYSLTIPADGTDLMQGLIEDEFKDAEFLPPIVSLDEFMESLNSEPPFDNLAIDAGQAKPLVEKVKSETSDKLMSSGLASKDPVDSKPGEPTKVDMNNSVLELDVKSSDNLVEQKHSNPNIPSGAEHVWEGSLQLHISALVTVIGLYRSGEKASTKEWPNSLEIKGRVRLDAFEKFLQELPMSRSRAVMVVNFILKAGSSEDERASLREVVDSYVVDERLGFAEPMAGMELYLCPPHQKILEILGKYLFKDQTEIINSTENGLIGVVVWRKAHVISPNATSQHKHSSKKQQHLTSSLRRQEKDTNVNVNATSRKPVSPVGQIPKRLVPAPNNNDEDEDDIPPGFGPGVARDDDDLPEFNFTADSNSAVPGRIPSQPSRLASLHSPQPSRPVDQIRELIQKYGQTEQNDSSRIWQDKRPAWNGDDDDDDIPEWRPEVPQRPSHGFHQPMQPHMVNQPIRSLVPSHLQGGTQAPMLPPNLVQNINPSWQQGGRLPQPQLLPRGFQPSSLGSQNLGQFHGGSVPPAGQLPGSWRRDAPRSRGF